MRASRAIAVAEEEFGGGGENEVDVADFFVRVDRGFGGAGDADGGRGVFDAHLEFEDVERLRVEPGGSGECGAGTAAAGGDGVAAERRGDVEIQADAGTGLAAFVAGRCEGSDVADEEIAHVERVTAVGNHAVAGEEVFDAGFEAIVAGP